MRTIEADPGEHLTHFAARMLGEVMRGSDTELVAVHNGRQMRVRFGMTLRDVTRQWEEQAKAEAEAEEAKRIDMPLLIEHLRDTTDSNAIYQRCVAIVGKHGWRRTHDH